MTTESGGPPGRMEPGQSTSDPGDHPTFEDLAPFRIGRASDAAADTAADAATGASAHSKNTHSKDSHSEDAHSDREESVALPRVEQNAVMSNGRETKQNLRGDSPQNPRGTSPQTPRGDSPNLGLSSAEAAARLESDGPNELKGVPPKPLWSRVAAQFADPLVYLLFVAMGISLLAWIFEGARGMPLDVLVIAVIVVANALIGLVEEGRAEKAVQELARMTQASSTVLRDGILVTIPSRELVVGDVLVLAEGDAIGADGVLLEAVGLKVQEAALTGEAEPVEKLRASVAPTPSQTARPRNANADAAQMGAARSQAAGHGSAESSTRVFKGTNVVHGVGRALVTATAMATRMGSIATLLDSRKPVSTPLDREISRLTRMLGLAVLAISALVMGVLFVLERPSTLAESVDILLIGVSLAVAAVPEGLPAILSLVLALGVQELAKRNAVVKSLHSVETLGSASVICTDKTGTLTRNEMTIRVVSTASGCLELEGTGYAPFGGVHGEADAGLVREAAAVIAAGAIANNAALVEKDNGEWTITGDPTEGAFLVAQHKIKGIAPVVQGARREAEVPFDSERKLMSVLAVGPHSQWRQLITKGAPDVLLPRCGAELLGETRVLLDEERRSRILAEVEELNSHGYRTLGVAAAPTSQAPEEIDEEDESDLVLLGIVGIIDPPREGAHPAVKAAQEAGIRVVMITGDHPVTAARIAADIGIDEGGAPMSGEEIDALDEEALRKAAPRTNVFARVAPEHKLRLVDAFKADGSVVAMTGDGVNDAPALKAADIGVAMGVTGTEVTKEAASMILGDDEFATIVDAVHRGRIIFDNIRKFMRYLLSSNMGEVVTVFMGIVCADLIGLSDAASTGGLAVPILAVQILWINLVTDTAPALAMGVDPEVDEVMHRAPRRVDDAIIDRAMGVRILLMGLLMGVVSLLVLDLELPGGLIPGGGADLETARTAAFTTLVLAQLFNAFNSRSDRHSAFLGLLDNPWLWAAIGLGIAAQIAVVHLPVLQIAFATSPLSLSQWITCAGVASLVLWVEEFAKVMRRLHSRSRTSEPA